ncbi:MAG: GTP-binding protein, partial [Dermatophilaceae bacterium]
MSVDTASREATLPDGTPASGVGDVVAQRPQLRLVVAGSVDDGKSTLVGRLLYDTKSILADQYEAIEAASARRGASDVDLALLTDGLRAEREQGITIDVAYRYFSTPRRSFILADTPGHTQYTRNTVTGASTADAALILVDVRGGVLVQTRRHLAVMALMAVRHVVVAVNKMDTVGWDPARFERVAADVREVARRIGIEDVRVIPISALSGQNVTADGASDEAGAWFDGPSVLDVLEGLEDQDVAAQDAARSFRMSVQLVIRPRTAEHPDYRGLAGRVGAGAVRVGDTITAYPSSLTSVVTGIDTPAGPAEKAVAGESVVLLLRDELDVGRGEVLARSGEPAPMVTQRLDAVVCWLAERPSTPNQRVLVKVGTHAVRAMLSPVVQRWHVDEQRWTTPDEFLGDAVDGPPAGARAIAAQLNDIVRLSIALAEPVATDDYARGRGSGAFIVIDPASGATLAAGMVGDHL